MALPKDVTQYMGITDTEDRLTATLDPTQPFEIGAEIYRWNPNEHQLLAWVMRNARRKPTVASRFGHVEKSHLPNWVKYIGNESDGAYADESSQQTTGLHFENGNSRLTLYSRLRTPHGEVIELSADMATTTDVTAGVIRNLGTSGTPLLKVGDWCKIISPGVPEGADMGEGPQQTGVYKTFRTGIIDHPVQMTGTRAAEKFIDGDPFVQALKDAWEASEDQLESAILFSAHKEDTTTFTYPLHTFTGMETFISTNVWAIDGVMSRMDFWDIIATWHKYYKGKGAVVCSGELVQLINTWAFHKVLYNQDLKKDGINISQIVTPAKADLDLVQCDLLGQEGNLQGMMLLLPADKIDYRPLIGNQNREIAYLPVDRDEKDLKEGHIFGEVGFEYRGEQNFGLVTGIEF